MKNKNRKRFFINSSFASDSLNHRCHRLNGFCRLLGGIFEGITQIWLRRALWFSKPCRAFSSVKSEKNSCNGKSIYKK